MTTAPNASPLLNANPDQRAAFLQSMRQVPGAVAIVACANGPQRAGLAATAWTSLCADPPMVLACVNQSASANALIRQTGAFSVNLVPATDQEIVNIFSGQRGLSGNERFCLQNWIDGALGQPVLKTAIATFECTIEAEHTYGTHSIFIGKVSKIYQNAQAPALLYVSGQFARAETTDSAS